jgi:hypothetical protein
VREQRKQDGCPGARTEPFVALGFASHASHEGDLQAAIELLLDDREAEISRGLPPDALRTPLQIG